MIHDKRPRAAELVPHGKGGTDRAAGISSSGLHVDPLKRCHPPDLAVGDRIHRAPARQCDIGQAGALLQRPDQVEERLFIHRLDRAGDIAVPILERIFGAPPWAQQFLERRAKINRPPAARRFPIGRASPRYGGGSMTRLSWKVPSGIKRTILRISSRWVGFPYGAKPMTLYSSP